MLVATSARLAKAINSIQSMTISLNDQPCDPAAILVIATLFVLFGRSIYLLLDANHGPELGDVRGFADRVRCAPNSRHPSEHGLRSASGPHPDMMVAIFLSPTALSLRGHIR